MGRVIIDGVVDPFVWGKVEVRWFLAHTVEYGLTYEISKLMYTLLTDTEAAFLGFSNFCASAGRDGCKLLVLLHEDATGEEVKRFIEDSYDVGGQPDICLSLSYLRRDPQLALRILLTKPDEVAVDPRQIKSRFTSAESLSFTRNFTHAAYSLGLPYLVRSGNLELYRQRGPVPSDP